MVEAEDISRQRLDKWLWYVRLQPTRSKAAEFIRLGYARLNGTRVTDPAKSVRVGDVLTLALPGRAIVVQVQAILPRRVAYTIAITAYHEIRPGD